ncbi:MAG: Trk system potassium transporter TrkA [bacterium]|nr:Trk system potassium transporter TrkA [bacterium]
MKIIIFGANKVGAIIASEFYTDNDITVIGNEKDKNDSLNKLDLSFVEGNGSDIDVLKQAGVKNADIFIACTASDELNIVACLTAKRIGNPCTMCFVRNEEYKASLGIAKDAEYNSEFYIDIVIWPEELLTQEIFRIITVAKALDVENFAGGRARLLEYRIEEDSILVNQAIRNCTFPKDTLIVGITRGENLFIPSGETVLQKDDKVIFMGLSHSLDVLAGKFFHKKGFVKNIAIIGGGNVGLKLAKSLEGLKFKTKIIERDEERCNYLAEQLSDALIINGDGTDLELLNEENISDSDVVVSVTNNDEKNLLCSLLAKQLGVNRVITRVSKNTNAGLFEKVGVDVSVSTQTASMNEIKSYIYGTNIGILATVEQGKGEVLTILLPQNFENTKIMDLKLPAKGIVGIVQRRNRIIIPNGTTQIMGEDNLIIFTSSENAPIIREYFKAD